MSIRTDGVVSRVLALAAAASALLIGAVGAGSTEVRTSSRPAAHAAQRPDPLAARKRCPKTALSLPGDGIVMAGRAAFIESRRLYPQAKGQAVTLEAVTRASRNIDPAEKHVRVACGARAQRRSVVAFLRFEGLPASQSQGTVIVARFRDGYHVWRVFH